jgi:hypothetical protein
MKMTYRTAVIATSAFVLAALFSVSWSEQGNMSLSISKADAATRVYVRGYPARAIYYGNEGLPWEAVRAYYYGGPWTYGYAGWTDYAARNGIGCTPGTAIKGADGIMYNCQ